MKTYLSGIVRDTDTKSTEKLKSLLVSMGCDIVFPKETNSKKLSWSDKLNSRLELLRDCPVIYMFPDWKSSITARIELTSAMNDKKHLCFSPDDIRDLITTLDS